MARKRSTTTVDDNITTDDITTDDDAAVDATPAAPEATAAPAEEQHVGLWSLELINPRTRQPEIHQVSGATEEEARANIRAGFQEVGGSIRRVV